MRITQWQSLRGTAGSLQWPAIISLLVVLPFIILELINMNTLRHGFPFALFAFMWLLSFSFILVLRPIPRQLRTENRSMADHLTLITRVGLLIFISWVWISLTVDQMPCFLGVPNCD